jgi:hypothetical protein
MYVMQREGKSILKYRRESITELQQYDESMVFE